MSWMRWVSGAGLGLCLGLQVAAAHAHDMISSDSRKAYLAALKELHNTAQSNAAPSVRAAARFQIGKTLDEIRELLNQDIISHGKTQGLETALLINELSASPTGLQYSSQTRLYLANLKHYRDAIALDARGQFVNAARFMILKGQFYDSFTDNPMKPLAQSGDDLLEMIKIGEELYRVRDQAQDLEEAGFILAIHYLQAADSNALPKARARDRFAELLRDFRQRYPQSLKLLTLEALSQ